MRCLHFSGEVSGPHVLNASAEGKILHFSSVLGFKQDLTISTNVLITSLIICKAYLKLLKLCEVGFDAFCVICVLEFFSLFHSLESQLSYMQLKLHKPYSEDLNFCPGESSSGVLCPIVSSTVRDRELLERV